MNAVWITARLVIGMPTTAEAVPARTAQEALRLIAAGQTAAVDDVRLAYAVMRLGGDVSHTHALEQIVFGYTGALFRSTFVPPVPPPDRAAALRAHAATKSLQRQQTLARQRPLEKPPATGHRSRHVQVGDKHLFVCRSCDWQTPVTTEQRGLELAEEHSRSTRAQ